MKIKDLVKKKAKQYVFNKNKKDNEKEKLSKISEILISIKEKLDTTNS